MEKEKDKQLERVYKKNPDVVYRVIAGESILLPISRETQAVGRMLTLNEVGAFIWERLDGKRTLAALLAEIEDEYDVKPDTARRDLLELIGSLKEARVIMPV